MSKYDRIFIYGFLFLLFVMVWRSGRVDSVPASVSVQPSIVVVTNTVERVSGADSGGGVSAVWPNVQYGIAMWNVIMERGREGVKMIDGRKYFRGDLTEWGRLDRFTTHRLEFSTPNGFVVLDWSRDYLDEYGDY